MVNAAAIRCSDKLYVIAAVSRLKLTDSAELSDHSETLSR
jgi:hypothetical protein